MPTPQPRRTARFESLEPRQFMATHPYVALGAGASPIAPAHIIVFDSGNSGYQHEFGVYAKGFHGGVRVAMADLNNDGVDEIIAAPGPGRVGTIKVFSIYGVELPQFRFNAYPKSLQGGVYVAAADVDGDGYQDLITTPGNGRAAEVRVWHNALGHAGIVDHVFSKLPLRDFLAFGKSFQGGATVGAADLNGDGKAEIVVGNEPGMSPHVRIFDLTTFKQSSKLKLASPVREILPLGANYRGGVFVAAGTDSAGNSKIVVGNGLDGDGEFEIYDAAGTLISRFETYEHFNPNFQSPIHVAIKNLSGEDLDEILTSPGVEWYASLTIWQFERSDIPVRLSGHAYVGLKYSFFVA